MLFTICFILGLARFGCEGLTLHHVCQGAGRFVEHLARHGKLRAALDMYLIVFHFEL